MKLSELFNISGIKCLKTVGDSTQNIKSIEIDSRKITGGSMFVAIRGTVTDGHEYINKAIEKGATAIVCEALPNEICENICYIQVDNSEKSVGHLASAFYGNPSQKLQLVGVTGTNGKTTTATLLYKLFKNFGEKAGLLSTVCNYIDGKEIPTDHTTPDPITLNKLLAQMVEAHCTYAFMEVSSHAVAQHRIAGLQFAGGIFTNITRDHLDYHKTFENYLKAKKGFFDSLPATAFALTNIDDKNGLVMLQNTKAQKYTYALKNKADFKAQILEHHFEGMLLDIDGKELSVQFVGTFNAYNLLAVYGAAKLLGKEWNEILVKLSALRPVKGRFDTITSPKGYAVVVDYAHTPDALINVLDTIHDVLQKKGRIITVVGAGGNRDKGKRPIMAHEAARLSDKLIITSDNPRFEEPQDIANDMLAGLDEDDKKHTISILDRKEAIRTACFMAEKGDVILVAGKGHETYQEIKGVKHHFDDMEVVEDFIKN